MCVEICKNVFSLLFYYELLSVLLSKSLLTQNVVIKGKKNVYSILFLLLFISTASNKIITKMFYVKL